MIRVDFKLEDMDMSDFWKGATYEQIKAYVLEKFGLKMSNLYISQIKRKCGIEIGQIIIKQSLNMQRFQGAHWRKRKLLRRHWRILEWFNYRKNRCNVLIEQKVEDKESEIHKMWYNYT